MKSKFIILGLTASVPIVLLFQNCSQAGNLNVSNGSSAAALNTSASSTDSLIINPVSSGDSSSSSQNNTSPDIHLSEPIPTSDDLIGSNDSDSASISSKCGRVEISDLLLQINSVSAGSSCETEKEQSFAVIDTDKTISLNKLSLKIKALKNIKIKELFLGLNNLGNKILTLDNLTMDLNTPSGQTAGIKVILTSDVSVDANQVYSLDLVIDPAEQLVSNPHKCIFKPIIKEASLSISQ